MRFTLHFTPAFRSFFPTAPLSRAERVRVLAELHASLPAVDDAYRADPANRVAPESACFWWQLVFMGDDGRTRAFRCAVDDSAAVYGVLRVVYADVT